ncbi:MAG: transposase, partial [Rhodococcus sp. (in: high G+C Gram-positive bacteria)]
NPQIRVIEHAPVRRCRDKMCPTPSRPRHRRVRRSAPAATPPVGVNQTKSVPAPQASVWDTVQPATPQGVTGSREEHTSPTPATSVVGSMRSM